MAWARMASSGTGLLVFIDDVTEDRSIIQSRNYENCVTVHIYMDLTVYIFKNIYMYVYIYIHI